MFSRKVLLGVTHATFHKKPLQELKDMACGWTYLDNFGVKYSVVFMKVCEMVTQLFILFKVMIPFHLHV